MAVTTGAGRPTALAGGGIRSVVRWLVRPAVERVSAGQGLAMTFVRLLVGVMWLYNVAWKVPPTRPEPAPPRGRSLATAPPPPRPMVAVHLLILFGGAGRHLAVDALRAGIARGVGLSRFWGGLSFLMGLTAIAVSAFGAPFGSSGANLQLPGLEFGLGTYNVGGGIALLLAGGALLSWSFGGAKRWLLWAAAVIALLAAVALRVQIGFSPPVLGGDGTSAAYFVTLAVVAIALARTSRSGARETPG